MTDGQSQPGSGQQQSGAAPAGGMTVEQIDRAARADNTRGHSPARDSREAAAARHAGQQQAGDQGGQQQQPAGGEERIKFGDQELTVAELADLRKFKGEQDAKKLTLPKDANAYELKMPDNFQAPAGVKFELNQNDPVIAKARELAHAKGMSQGDFSDFLGLYAADRIRQATVVNSAREAELAKLGAAGTARIDAIKTFLHGVCGSELGSALEQTLCTEKQVRGFERILQRMSSQGGTQFDNRGREQQEQQAGKIPGYDKMTFEQKRAAQMARMPQTQRTFRDNR